MPDLSGYGRWQRPIDRSLAGRFKEGVGLREMAAAEEAVMRGKRRRMRRLEHEMPAIAIDRFDERRLLLRVAAPQQERDRGLACVDQPDDGVGRSEEHTSELQSL